MVKALEDIIAKSSSIVFFGGAGVSTESGIPDFRSVDGLYHQKYDYPPETILSHTFWEENPEEFYRFYRDKLIVKGAKPNAAHLRLAKLEQQGKLRAVVTQNIDGLHQAVLVGVLAVQRLDHHLVGTTLDDQPVNDDALGLALAVEPRFALGVKLQAPGQAVPDQVVTALLQVQPVSGKCRMDEGHRDLSRVPVGEVLRLSQFLGFHPLPDMVLIVLEPVRHQDRLPSGTSTRSSKASSFRSWMAATSLPSV